MPLRIRRLPSTPAPKTETRAEKAKTKRKDIKSQEGGSKSNNESRGVKGKKRGIEMRLEMAGEGGLAFTWLLVLVLLAFIGFSLWRCKNALNIYYNVERSSS